MMDAYQQHSRLKMINLQWKLINNWHFFGFSLVSSQFSSPTVPHLHIESLNIMYLRTHREAWLIFLFYYTFYFFLRRYIKYWKWTHRGRFIESEMRWYSSIFSSVHHSHSFARSFVRLPVIKSIKMHLSQENENKQRACSRMHMCVTVNNHENIIIWLLRFFSRALRVRSINGDLKKVKLMRLKS